MSSPSNRASLDDLKKVACRIPPEGPVRRAKLQHDESRDHPQRQHVDVREGAEKGKDGAETEKWRQVAPAAKDSGHREDERAALDADRRTRRRASSTRRRAAKAGSRSDADLRRRQERARHVSRKSGADGSRCASGDSGAAKIARHVARRHRQGRRGAPVVTRFRAARFGAAAGPGGQRRGMWRQSFTRDRPPTPKPSARRSRAPAGPLDDLQRTAHGARRLGGRHPIGRIAATSSFSTTPTV